MRVRGILTHMIKESPKYMTEPPTVENLQNLLENLYTINKHAKDYKNGGKSTKDVGYSNRDMNQKKKEALYRMKSDILGLIKDKAKKIELHNLPSGEYYCLYFRGGWSFHIPTKEIEIDEVDEKKRIPNFSSSSKKTRTDTQLREALKYFQKELGINANNYIEQEYTKIGNQNYFTGWPYLG